MTKPNWLKISEYVALGASAVGTIVAVVSKQIIYAAAPIAVTGGLYIAKRLKHNQPEQLQSPTVPTQVHQPNITSQSTPTAEPPREGTRYSTAEPTSQRRISKEALFEPLETLEPTSGEPSSETPNPVDRTKVKSLFASLKRVEPTSAKSSSTEELLEKIKQVEQLSTQSPQETPTLGGRIAQGRISKDAIFEKLETDEPSSSDSPSGKPIPVDRTKVRSLFAKIQQAEPTSVPPSAPPSVVEPDSTESALEEPPPVDRTKVRSLFTNIQRAEPTPATPDSQEAVLERIQQIETSIESTPETPTPAEPTSGEPPTVDRTKVKSLFDAIKKVDPPSGDQS
ncbi:MAG: hypothetical protein LDL41_01235 [Coleofasciculus sp. S288]|nr:hypothetical protein [Coleofasciculus sp. S288]